MRVVLKRDAIGAPRPGLNRTRRRQVSVFIDDETVDVDSGRAGDNRISLVVGKRDPVRSELDILVWGRLLQHSGVIDAIGHIPFTKGTRIRLSPIIRFEGGDIAVADDHMTNVANHGVIDDRVQAALVAAARNTVDRAMWRRISSPIGLIDHRLNIDSRRGPDPATMDRDDLNRRRCSYFTSFLLDDKDVIVVLRRVVGDADLPIEAVLVSHVRIPLADFVAWRLLCKTKDHSAPSRPNYNPCCISSMSRMLA